MLRALVPVVVALLVPGAASAHPVSARLSSSGLEFLEEQLPDYVPREFQPTPATFTVSECLIGSSVAFTQQNTTAHLLVKELDLSLPESGTLRLELTASVLANGEAVLEMCVGSADCNDFLSAVDVHIVMDFIAWVDEVGALKVQVANVSILEDPDDFEFELSDCWGIDTIANLVISAGKKWGVDMLTDKLEQMAVESIGPRIQAMLQGFAQYQGNVGIADFNARLLQVDAGPDGIGIAEDVDVTTKAPLAECLPGDPGEPESTAGPMPDLSAGPPAHFGLAVNLGVINDALYHTWREGLLCITPDRLAALGFKLDLNTLVALVPGLPPGTQLALQGLAAVPPRIETTTDDTLALTLKVDQVILDLDATMPTNEVKRLHIELDASAAVNVSLDTGINALALAVKEIHLDRFVVDDEVGLDALGFDYERLHALAEEVILPTFVAQLTSMPVTGPVFGGMNGYFVILRDLHTTSAFLVAKADLFRAPDNDTTSPDTILRQVPEEVVRPKDAIVLAGGVDAEIPPELLRFLVTVDGEALGMPSYVRQFTVGRPGKTATYHVSVTAMDLAGNLDDTPATADVTVDGIPPKIHMVEALAAVVESRTPTVRWTAEDDLTAPDALSASIKVVRLPVQGGDAAPELIGETQLGVGATSAALNLPAGGQYRAILSVSDRAGNVGSEAMIFSVPPQSGMAGGCRLATAPGADGGGELACLFVAWLVARRRRR